MTEPMQVTDPRIPAVNQSLTEHRPVGADGDAVVCAACGTPWARDHLANAVREAARAAMSAPVSVDDTTVPWRVAVDDAGQG